MANPTPPSTSGLPNRTLDRPEFAQPQPTPDPATFVVKHPSDDPLYTSLDAYNKEHGLHATPFPNPRGFPQNPEPRLTLQDVLGGATAATNIGNITNTNKQIVFHALGDCGSVGGPVDQNYVTDKLVADFNEVDPRQVPQFHMLLGDIVYSFGQVVYYYDQFYEPYRDYPAPILAAAGNHDASVAPGLNETSLEGYLRNFCQSDFVVMPEANKLSRTAQIQPGVFFTFDAPFVRIIVLFSNWLENPGIISDADTGTAQLTFLKAALTRVKTENYKGALLLAHHHPIYAYSRNGGSPAMLAQIDAICEEVGVWPHADLAGHSHNYQRFTRYRPDGTEIPYIVCGNGGHAPLQVLSKTQIVQQPSASTDKVSFDRYDDKNFGYLRITVNSTQLHIEYHPASDGTTTKTPDDAVTVDLASRKIVNFNPPDTGMPKAAAATHAAMVAQLPKSRAREAPAQETRGKKKKTASKR